MRSGSGYYNKAQLVPIGRIEIPEWQILGITESMYFLECATIATAAVVAIDYGIYP